MIISASNVQVRLKRQATSPFEMTFFPMKLFRTLGFDIHRNVRLYKVSMLNKTYTTEEYKIHERGKWKERKGKGREEEGEKGEKGRKE